MHGGIKFSLSPTKFKHSAVSCVEQYCSISYQKHINCRFMATATWLEFDTLFRWWLLNYGEFSLATCTVTESLLCQTPVCSPRWTEWISETTTESQGVHAQRSTRKWIHAHFSTTIQLHTRGLSIIMSLFNAREIPIGLTRKCWAQTIHGMWRKFGKPMCPEFNAVLAVAAQAC